MLCRCWRLRCTVFDIPISSLLQRVEHDDSDEIQWTFLIPLPSSFCCCESSSTCDFRCPSAPATAADRCQGLQSAWTIVLRVPTRDKRMILRLHHAPHSQSPASASAAWLQTSEADLPRAGRLLSRPELLAVQHYQRRELRDEAFAIDFDVVARLRIVYLAVELQSLPSLDLGWPAKPTYRERVGFLQNSNCLAAHDHLHCRLRPKPFSRSPMLVHPQIVHLAIALESPPPSYLW